MNKKDMQNMYYYEEGYSLLIAPHISDHMLHVNMIHFLTLHFVTFGFFWYTNFSNSTKYIKKKISQCFHSDF